MRNVQVGRVAEAVLTIDLIYEEGAKGPHRPIVRNVQLSNVTSTASPRVMWIKGFEGTTIDRIRFENCTFNGVAETEVLEHAGTITLQGRDHRALKQGRSNQLRRRPIRGQLRGPGAHRHGAGARGGRGRPRPRAAVDVVPPRLDGAAVQPRRPTKA